MHPHQARENSRDQALTKPQSIEKQNQNNFGFLSINKRSRYRGATFT